MLWGWKELSEEEMGGRPFSAYQKLFPMVSGDWRNERDYLTKEADWGRLQIFRMHTEDYAVMMRADRLTADDVKDLEQILWRLVDCDHAAAIRFAFDRGGMSAYDDEERSRLLGIIDSLPTGKAMIQSAFPDFLTVDVLDVAVIDDELVRACYGVASNKELRSSASIKSAKAEWKRSKMLTFGLGS